jgi:hypothetical protein
LDTANISHAGFTGGNTGQGECYETEDGLSGFVYSSRLIKNPSAAAGHPEEVPPSGTDEGSLYLLDSIPRGGTDPAQRDRGVYPETGKNIPLGGIPPRRAFFIDLLGVLLPYSQFVPWLVASGLDMPLFFQQLFVNRISAFFGMDVLVSAVVLLVFVRHESSRLGTRGRWLPLIAVLTVGVSFGLPLFLYMRERKLEQDRAERKTDAL